MMEIIWLRRKSYVVSFEMLMEKWILLYFKTMALKT